MICFLFLGSLTCNISNTTSFRKHHCQGFCLFVPWPRKVKYSMPIRTSCNSDSEQSAPRVIPFDAPSLTSSRTHQLNNQFDNFLWIDWLDNFARMHTLFQGGLHRQGEVCLGSWTKTWFWSKSWLTLPAHPWSSIPSPKPKAQALSTFLDHIYEEILWEGKNKQE